MKSFLFKYQWKLVWLVIVTIVIFFLAPKQERYYPPTELALFTRQINLGLIILLGLLFLAISILGYRRNENVKEALLFSGNLLLIFLALYFVLSPFAKAAILYTNRLVNKKEENRSYVAIHSSESISRRSFALYGIGIKEILWSDELPAQVLRSIDKPKDTVQLKLAKGLFNVYYLEDK